MRHGSLNSLFQVALYLPAYVSLSEYAFRLPSLHSEGTGGFGNRSKVESQLGNTPTASNPNPEIRGIRARVAAK